MTSPALLKTLPNSSFEIETFTIKGVVAMHPKVFRDNRGHFVETFRERDFTAAGIDCRLVQDQKSLSLKKGTLRGLHFQKPPHAQAKLVHCTRGRVYDVAVDLRIGSPSYGEHVGIELSAEKASVIYIPAGFAHGFCTLEDNCEVAYKVSAYYAPTHEGGIAWNDPDLAIAWPGLDLDNVILSEKDMILPRLKALQSPFTLTEEAAPALAENAA